MIPSISRRDTLHRSMVVALAGFAGVTTTKAARIPPNDIAIIQASQDIVAAEDALNELCGRRRTIQQEHQTENEWLATVNRRSAARELLEQLDPPSTMAAVLAMSRATLASAERDRDGEIATSDHVHWAALNVLWVLTEHSGVLA